MKARYRIFRRSIRGGAFYCVDTRTGKRTSLGTRSEDEASQIIEAKNQSERQPLLNLQIAKAYLAGTDNGITTRTWKQAIEALIDTKQGANRERWLRVVKDKALGPLLPRVIIETQGDFLLRVIQTGTVSTNVYVRRLHNFCLDMNWLPWPLIPKRRWPLVRFKEKRAITWDEHRRIVSGETNDELRDYYKLLWHFGASQTDMALLQPENINWNTNSISYGRKKSGTRACIRFGEEAAGILRRRDQGSLLFPKVSRWKESDRAKAFMRRCRLVGVSGVSLHSYRYAWAERARKAGYPERFAQEALGHSCAAVHRAYAKRAQFTVPALEEYEKLLSEGRQVSMPNVALATTAA